MWLRPVRSLPRGWTWAQDPTTRHVYYYNPKTGGAGVTHARCTGIKFMFYLVDDTKPCAAVLATACKCMLLRWRYPVVLSRRSDEDRAPALIG